MIFLFINIRCSIARINGRNNYAITTFALMRPNENYVNAHQTQIIGRQLLMLLFILLKVFQNDRGYFLTEMSIRHKGPFPTEGQNPCDSLYSPLSIRENKNIEYFTYMNENSTILYTHEFRIGLNLLVRRHLMQSCCGMAPLSNGKRMHPCILAFSSLRKQAYLLCSDFQRM